MKRRMSRRSGTFQTNLTRYVQTLYKMKEFINGMNIITSNTPSSPNGQVWKEMLRWSFEEKFHHHPHPTPPPFFFSSWARNIWIQQRLILARLSFLAFLSSNQNMQCEDREG